ncbi:MAG TPA: hypothetical protein VF121_06485 [Thermoanaerobaculia bacterium]|nr:hypothetical protein [Thermoanaerobaculia bacterium]
MDLSAADEALRRGCPALWECLSPLGRRLRQPANFLPQQSAEARGKPFNATIGQITDGHGRAVPLPAMAAAVPGLSAAELSRAFLYSPVEGFPELRRRWRERQRQGVPDEAPSSLPLVTAGRVQALAIAAELFAGEDTPVALPAGVSEDYAATFTLRTGARRVAVEELGGEADGEPALVVLGGEDGAERQAPLARLAAVAAHRPLAVIVDDSEPSPSAFWHLAALHPNLFPVKVDAAGEGVGFLTFPFLPESALASAIESKAKTLLRALIGSPPAFSQALLLAT